MANNNLQDLPLNVTAVMHEDLPGIIMGSTGGWIGFVSLDRLFRHLEFFPHTEIGAIPEGQGGLYRVIPGPEGFIDGHVWDWLPRPPYARQGKRALSYCLRRLGGVVGPWPGNARFDTTFVQRVLPNGGGFVRWIVIRDSRRFPGMSL